MSNTVRTVFGFLGAVARRRLAFLRGPLDLSRVFNYVLLPGAEGDIATSGQPNESELRQIGAEGYELVVNLAPQSMLENSVIEEAAILAEVGVPYVHIPVDFKAPTDGEFEQLAEILDAHRAQKVWVHCAANMRVSAFMYRYRVEKLGVPAPEARLDLERIWEPFGVWKGFVADRSGDRSD